MDFLSKELCNLAGAVRELVCEVKTQNDHRSILHRIEQAERNIMSQIGDWTAKVGPKLDRVQTGLDAVQALVEKFQNSPGTLTPDDQKLLDEIEAKVDAIATDADSVPPVPPVA